MAQKSISIKEIAKMANVSVPETFIQLGETETAVYLRTLERVFAFGKGNALYLARLPLILEQDSNTLFR